METLLSHDNVDSRTRDLSIAASVEIDGVIPYARARDYIRGMSRKPVAFDARSIPKKPPAPSVRRRVKSRRKRAAAR
jgi:hypothetical protein